MTNHGSFPGNPKTEWLETPDKPDRDMALLEKFFFKDPDGRIWPAPKEAVINGASIPQPLWSILGSPYTDDYRRASIVHDVACNTVGVKRKEADIMFYHACRAGGCGAIQAGILYAGVRLGAWASRSLTARSLSPRVLLYRDSKDGPSPEAVYLQDKLSEISRDMKGLPEEPSIAELDSIIKRHVKI